MARFRFSGMVVKIGQAGKMAKTVKLDQVVSGNMLIKSSGLFWQQKSLEQMSDAEWEALCDGCGKCCLHKLIDADTDELYFTSVACELLNLKSCQCRHYEKRMTLVSDCIKIDRGNLADLVWLPSTCAYRLLAEGSPLPDWHPLLTGSKSAMHKAGQSVRGKAICETEIVGEMQEYIVSWPL